MSETNTIETNTSITEKKPKLIVLPPATKEDMIKQEIGYDTKYWGKKNMSDKSLIDGETKSVRDEINGEVYSIDPNEIIDDKESIEERIRQEEEEKEEMKRQEVEKKEMEKIEANK